MIKLEEAKSFTINDINILMRGLDEQAKEIRGQEPEKPFAFFLYDDDNSIVGGCSGTFYYGCAYIDRIWIEKQYRNIGYGTKLMQAAEEQALANNCKFSILEMMDWGPLEFYKKQGYSIESELHGYHNNSTLYRMRKELT